MSNQKSFLDFLNKFIPIPQEEFDVLVSPRISTRIFDKKEIITRPGEVENYLNFIVKGLVRKFYRKGNEEISSQISYEGHIIHAQESFHSRTPSEYTVEAIEPSVLISITYDNLEKIYTASHKMEHLGRLVVTATLVTKDRWQDQIANHSPRERFMNFVNKYPEMLQRVPQKYLASLLKIQPETFSRFKHLVKEQCRKNVFQEG